MKDLLKRITPPSIKRWLKSHVQPTTPTPPQQWTYAEDGLCTMHLADFLHDPRFQQAYAAGKATGSWGEGDLRWRIYLLLWAAEQAWKLPGDFVESGVHKGGQAQAILHYLNWPTQSDRSFYLLDTFCGFPPEHRELAAEVHRHDYLEDCFAQVHDRFRAWPSVKLVQGAVPGTLHQVASNQIAFLSIDMNCAEPEVAALAYFWPHLVSGGLVLLDDYAFAEPYRRQKEALDRWATTIPISILSLPTGQGLIIKP